ncbi:hypothetical protein GF359_08885 [candidate division WOR-3 bacterium]|uniref:VWA domain-containing protein n=1 Tax=candidate division WOR-3 bacterium TaxID=2052148 RepID=A0A9D5KBU8_UNCW3|nr:hypothetical protein [candidate division WOR-3 bacterium]MBD3365314.1 hypothetical protein [candidate division WOR-3 bacterium]
MKFLNWLLRGLTIAALALLFVPVIQFRIPGTRSEVILLVDNSASMSAQNKQDEWKRISEILMKSKVRLKTYAFSDSLSAARNLSSLRFQDSRTDISKAIDGIKSIDADAYLLVSDGRHNGPTTPTASGLEIHLWTIGLGDRNLPDISIEGAEIRDSTNLRIRIRSTGTETRLVNLSVFAGKRKVAEREVSTVSDRLSEVALGLNQTPENSEIRIHIDSVPGEDRVDNNTFILKSRPASRDYEVLFLSASISRETDFLLGVLKTLSGVDIKTYVEVSPQVSVGAAPETPDIVVIGPLRSNLSQKNIDLIKAYARKGIPLLFISTGSTLPRELQSLYPLDKRPATPDISKMSYAPISHILFSDWDPVTAIGTNSGETYYKLKPEANALLSSGNATLAAELEDKSLALELPDLVGIKTGDIDGFSTTIRRIIAYLIEGDAFPFSFSVNSATTSAVDLTLYSEVELDYSIETVSAWLKPDSIPLQVLPQSNKMSRLIGSVPVIQPEDSTDVSRSYRLNLSWRGNRFRPGPEITVRKAPGEGPSKGSNPQLLEHLAAQGGGKVLEIDQLDDWSLSLPKGKLIIFKPLETPFIVILIGLLFILEIWYRRRIGLP